MTATFDFPVWVFVNTERRSEDGYPYYLLHAGGERTPLPKTLMVFSSEDRATRHRSNDAGFEPKMVQDAETLKDILSQLSDTEEVLLDCGFPDATIYKAEEFR